MIIAHLPPELIRHIAKYLKPHVPSIDSDEGLRNRPEILWRWFEMPTIFEKEDSWLRSDTPIPIHGRCSDLKALRLTNHYFDEICTPLIYVELDILPQRAAMPNISAILSHYPEHVRHLRIGVTRVYTGASRKEEYDQTIIEALRLCKHTTSLAVYFEGEAADDEITPAYNLFMNKLGGEVASLVMREKLSSLGIYSVGIEDSGSAWGDPPIGISELLASVIPVLDGRSVLRRLVIASECISQGTYDDIQSRAASIQSVTFKACFSDDNNWAVPTEVWTPGRASKWVPNANLTHLRLIRCEYAYAPHIPELVRHFSALKYLLVTACGSDNDVQTSPRRTGWSREPNALWKQRPPLDVFHIKHMLKWQIVAMGTIPSKTVISTSLDSEDLASSFITDPELFPCLNILRIEGTRTKGGTRLTHSRTGGRESVAKGDWGKERGIYTRGRRIFVQPALKFNNCIVIVILKRCRIHHSARVQGSLGKRRAGIWTTTPMANIAHLPVELILSIIEHLPHIPYMDTDEALMSKSNLVERWNTGFLIFNEPQEGDDNHAELLAEERQRNAQMVRKRVAYKDLLSLRQVNHYFKELCEPLFYTELDILPQRAAIQYASAVLSRHGNYVRHLSIVIPREHAGNARGDAYDRLIEEAVDVCRCITSLNVYYESEPYHYEDTPAYHEYMSRLGSKLTDLATQGSVSSLGIGSLGVVRSGYGPYGIIPLGIRTLLQSFLPLLHLTPTIRHLELACEAITPEIYTNIRSNATSLHSLTFGGCLTRNLEGIWNLESTSKWALNANLTHLRLIHCQIAYPPHIPELVRHFSSLKQLFVTTCGDFSDVRTVPHAGWSREKNAIWRQRPPLDVFFFEHMLEWEILAMGTIPAKTVIATSIVHGHLGRSFTKDPEIFPGLTLLRIESSYEDGDGDDVLWKEKISQKRGIVVEANAKWLVTQR